MQCFCQIIIHERKYLTHHLSDPHNILIKDGMWQWAGAHGIHWSRAPHQPEAPSLIEQWPFEIQQDGNTLKG